MKRAALLLAATLLLAGCETSSNLPARGEQCDEAMSETQAKYGTPEEVNTYTTSGYNSQTWWYWSQGLSVGFVWGSDVSRWSCDLSYYTFDPIY